MSMMLRDRGVAAGLFKPGWPIYTQTNDSSPSKYAEGSSVRGSVVANGCVIEGTVKDSIISRNVTIRKGAVVKTASFFLVPISVKMQSWIMYWSTSMQLCTMSRN
jgi:glucose-1-phosphate adenylyltransferase